MFTPIVQPGTARWMRTEVSGAPHSVQAMTIDEQGVTADMPGAGPDRIRIEPDLQTGELTLLGQYIDYHRATLELKCAGLTDEELKRPSISVSTLTLLGLVRHLTEVERSWFRRVLDAQDAPPLYWSDADVDGDFDRLDSAPVAQVWATYRDEVAESRRILATFADGGALARGTVRSPRNVRWVLTHAVEEYARHNGHADLLRQLLDGSTGE